MTNAKLLLPAAAMAVSACMGGGGGSSPPPPTPIVQAAPSFVSAPPNSTFAVVADARTGSRTTLPSGAEAISVTAEPGSRATVGFNQTGGWSALSISSIRAPFSANESAGDTFDRTGGKIRMEANGGRDIGSFRTSVPTEGGLNPQIEQLEHMTFGVWASGTGVPLSSIGVGAFGWATNPSALRGLAAYDGAIDGIYVDRTAALFATEGRLTADINFDTGAVTAVTRETRKIGNGINEFDPRLDFFMNGTVTGNVLSGRAVTGSGVMTGEFTGRVFGPQGQEIGGTFNLDGADGRHVGAFGARAR